MSWLVKIDYACFDSQGDLIFMSELKIGGLWLGLEWKVVSFYSRVVIMQNAIKADDWVMSLV